LSLAAGRVTPRKSPGTRRLPEIGLLSLLFVVRRAANLERQMLTK
jgi:hypothetical protein